MTADIRWRQRYANYRRALAHPRGTGPMIRIHVTSVLVDDQAKALADAQSTSYSIAAIFCNNPGAYVLERARLSQGLERMEQIKYAVLERDGSISIIPR